MKKILFIMLAMMLIASCSSSRIPVVIPESNASSDTVFVYKEHRDSVYVHDSIYTVIEHKGDTVLIEKDVYKIQYRDRYVCDTTYISKNDTITQRVVTNELTTWQQREINFGKFAMVILAALIIGFIAKFVKKIMS